MKRNFIRCIAVLTLAWTGTASAALMQEFFFYFPQTLDGTVAPDSFENLPMPQSVLPSIKLTYPGECGSINGASLPPECLDATATDIGIEFSAFDPSTHIAEWKYLDLVIASWVLLFPNPQIVAFDFGAFGGIGLPGEMGQDIVFRVSSVAPYPLSATGLSEYRGATGTGFWQFYPGHTDIAIIALSKPVPLPGTLALFGLGLAGLIARRRRA